LHPSRSKSTARSTTSDELTSAVREDVGTN
jgi:hypothetical protein